MKEPTDPLARERPDVKTRTWLQKRRSDRAATDQVDSLWQQITDLRGTETFTNSADEKQVVICYSVSGSKILASGMLSERCGLLSEIFANFFFKFG